MGTLPLFLGHQGELASATFSGASALIYVLGTTLGIQLEGNYLDTREGKLMNWKAVLKCSLY